MNAPRVHRVEVDGVSLHVEERGRGTPLLLLHGFTGSSESMAGCARALQRHYRVISLDLVGHGRSDAPDDLAAYSMPRCVEQIAGVLQTLDAAPAHVLGYSMGGRSALSLLDQHPECVRSLVLVGASAGLEGCEERAARVASDEALAERIERFGLERFVDDWMALPLFASQTRRLDAESLARARAQRLASPPRGLANSLRGMGTGAQPPLHARLGCLSVPILLVVGDEDAKFQGIARDLASRLPRAEVARVRDAGHAAHLENPAGFLDIAARFLAAHTPEFR